MPPPGVTAIGRGVEYPPFASDQQLSRRSTGNGVVVKAFRVIQPITNIVPVGAAIAGLEQLAEGACGETLPGILEPPTDNGACRAKCRASPGIGHVALGQS